MNKSYFYSILIAITILIGYFIYSSHNRYELNTEGNRTYKIDRVTGETWALFGETKVQVIEEEPYVEPKIETLSFQEISKLEGTASVSSGGYFRANIYNGSNFRVNEIQVKINVYNNVGEEDISRVYSLTPRSYTTGAPRYRNTEFNSSLGFSLNNREWSWSITRATGYPSE